MPHGLQCEVCKKFAEHGRQGGWFEVTPRDGSYGHLRIPQLPTGVFCSVACLSQLIAKNQGDFDLEESRAHAVHYALRNPAGAAV